MSISIRVLTDADAEKCCGMSDAIEAMQVAFSTLCSGEANVPVRTNLLATAHTESLVMPVAIPKINRFGLKAVSLTDDNSARGLPRIHAAILLFDSTTGQPAGLLNGEYLTALRTGAASGFATKLLASETASCLVVFGTGRQAIYQVLGVLKVRPIRKIVVVARELEKANSFCEKLRIDQNVSIVATTDAHAVAEADIICTATSSSTPLFDAGLLRDNCHVNAIGSYRSDMAELSPNDISRFKVFVDQRQACQKEAGEIVQAIQMGHIQADALKELGEIDLSDDQYHDFPTLFKSVGNAAQDLVVADLVLRKAHSKNLGQIVQI